MQLKVDVDKLTWEDIEALEDLKGLKSARAWLAEHAGLSDAEIKAIPAKDIMPTVKQLRGVIAEALELPKASD